MLEAVEEVLPPPQAAGVDIGGQVDLLDAVSLGRQPGVQEPGVGRPAQEPRILARPDAPVGVEDPVRERDRRRQPAAGGADPAEQGPQAGGVVRRARIGVLEVHRLVGPPREHVVAAGGVGVVARGHGPEDAELVGHQGGARQQLGERQAGHGRGDRAEVAPDLGGGVRLGVPGRVLGRAAHQEQEDARPRPAERIAGRHPAAVRRNRPPGQVGEVQPGPEHAQAADAEDLPAVEAVAEPGARAEQSEHECLAAPGAWAVSNRCLTTGL